MADLVGAKNINASFGVIGDSFVDDGNKQDFYDWIISLNNTGYIEIWHHGYEHIKAADSSWYEFSNTDYTYQYTRLRDSIDLVLLHTGITLRSFGAPYNQNDTTTITAMDANPEIEVWMFPKLSPTNQYLLTSRVNFENGTGIPDYNYFVTNYNNNQGMSYMVLQGHPKEWDATKMAEFEDILDFLIAENSTFMTPYEYYQYMTQ